MAKKTSAETRLRVYCSIPKRLDELREVIVDYVTNQGYGVLLPFKTTSSGRIMRKRKTRRSCNNLIAKCDKFLMFGVSEETWGEFVYALKKGRANGFRFKGFDPNWKKYFKRLVP